MKDKTITIDKIVDMGYTHREPYQLNGKPFFVFSCLTEMFYDKYLVCELIEPPNAYRVMELYFQRKKVI